jgi:hypothetical protein
MRGLLEVNDREPCAHMVHLSRLKLRWHFLRTRPLGGRLHGRSPEQTRLRLGRVRRKWQHVLRLHRVVGRRMIPLPHEDVRFLLR